MREREREGDGGRAKERARDSAHECQLDCQTSNVLQQCVAAVCCSSVLQQCVAVRVSARLSGE